jgi:hypothetical protein
MPEFPVPLPVRLPVGELPTDAVDFDAADPGILDPLGETWQPDALADDDALESIAAPELEQPDALPEAAMEPEDSPASPGFDGLAEESPFDVQPSAAGAAGGLTLGPVGVDAQGRRGRIHTVVPGDTLWDISDAYLGTPWVWPSVWNDNRSIPNPHLISIGDRIWITDSEMRPVSDEEAEQLISQTPAAFDLEPPAVEEVADLEPIAEIQEIEVSEEEPDPPLVMDQFPVSVPTGESERSHRGRTVRVSSRESMGFVSSELVDGATSIVGSPVPRFWLAGGDLVYLGLGEGEVKVGDQFTVFRDTEVIRDLSESIVGFHVRVLGWVEVREVQEETSIAEIRISAAEMKRGDRVVPRDPPPVEVVVRPAPEGLTGRIIHMPSDRTVMGSVDYVYLNRGTIDGLEVGSELEVFESGSIAIDYARFSSVQTPDRSVAKLVVVLLKPQTSVGFVIHASRELEVGDAFRAVSTTFAQR